MWDLITSAPVAFVASLVFTVIVGVATNLLTPLFVRLWSTNSNSRRNRIIDKIVRSHNRFLIRSSRPTVVLDCIWTSASAIFCLVLFSLCAVSYFVLAFSNNLINIKITELISEPNSHYIVQFCFAIFLLIIANVFFTFSFIYYKLTYNIVKSACFPDIVRNEALAAAQKIDSNFDENRLYRNEQVRNI